MAFKLKMKMNFAKNVTVVWCVFNSLKAESQTHIAHPKASIAHFSKEIQRAGPYTDADG